jgi:glycosyltransferase involved in cell wall biosynthesis
VAEGPGVIRVGFGLAWNGGWHGGTTYFRNLLTALYELPDRGIEAVVFTGLKTPDDQFDGFPAVEVIRNRLFDHGEPSWLISKTLQRFGARDALMERFLSQQEIAVLSHSGWLGPGSSLPAIGWIPDFQHKHLPDLFSAREIASRNRTIFNTCRHCQKVIVSSVDAQSDLLRFLPDYGDKCVVLHFVAPAPAADAKLRTRAELEDCYKFSGPYFLLPNQFWKHKNHAVVIEALAHLRSTAKNILILATGNNRDYRHPGHFEWLMNLATERNVRDNFRYLGMVSTEDLAALMEHSVGIINPSLFEGWSTSVEEAKSIGKLVLLSDIPVHREQNPALGSYFAPDDSSTLANQLWEVWNQVSSNGATAREAARILTSHRRVEFARRYERIVSETLRKL